MRFVVRSLAREYILNQFRFYSIERRDEAAALRFLDAVESTVTQICRQPEIGAPKRLRHPKLTGLRSWPVKGFEEIRVYYLFSLKVVRVVRVLHGKRDVDTTLARD